MDRPRKLVSYSRTTPDDKHFDAGAPDAALSACGLAEPGSECSDVAELRRCDGTKVVTESCAPGMLCGQAPLTGQGAACLEVGGDCGDVAYSACSGPILTVCSRGKLALNDCRALFATCVSDDLGERCATPCDEAGVTATGRCEGNAIRRCAFENGVYRVELAACPDGTTCMSTDPITQFPSCRRGGGCAGVGERGSCDGEVLSRCISGARSETDCAVSGGVCTWGGEGGYTCAPAGTVGARAISGEVRYERREIAGDRQGAIVTRPARSVAVVIVDDASGAALASGATDDKGHYRLHHAAAAGAAVHVLVVTLGPGADRPVSVLRPDGLLSGFAGPSVAAGDDTTADVLVTDVSGVSPALAILDTLMTGVDAIREIFDDPAPPAVTAIFARDLEVISQTQGTTITVISDIVDDDSYDDSVLLHELGHVVENVYGRTSNPGGTHFLYDPEAPTLAWSEGFASYFSSVVRGDPRYVDTNIAGALSFDIDEDVTRAVATSAMTQKVSENMVSEILWDLGDSGAGDDDAAPGTHPGVLRVESMALHAAAADRGVCGVDLVDFLDGYLLLEGQGICAATRGVVDSRGFPYDFAAQVSCPH